MSWAMQVVSLNEIIWQAMLKFVTDEHLKKFFKNEK